MRLTRCLHRFFGYYLTRVKGVSPNTVQVHKKSFQQEFIEFRRSQ